VKQVVARSDTVCLFELSTALIDLGRLQLAAIQGRDAFSIQQSPSHHHPDHLIEEPLHLLATQFADVGGQTLWRERPLLLLASALRLTSLGQALFHLPRIEAH
jgi:hypothetical protein